MPPPRDGVPKYPTDNLSTSSSNMSSDSTRTRVELKPQLIERKVVDQQKLIQKLRNRYGTAPDGTNNFKVMLRLNRYTIMVPETLTEREINEFSLF